MRAILLGGLSDKESACQRKRRGFDPWVGTIPWKIMEVMESHSSVLAGRISWTEEPGGLQSIGAQRVGHDCACKHKESKLKKIL